MKKSCMTGNFEMVLTAEHKFWLSQVIWIPEIQNCTLDNNNINNNNNNVTVLYV